MPGTIVGLIFVRTLAKRHPMSPLIEMAAVTLFVVNLPLAFQHRRRTSTIGLTLEVRSQGSHIDHEADWGIWRRAAGRHVTAR